MNDTLCFFFNYGELYSVSSKLSSAPPVSELDIYVCYFFLAFVDLRRFSVLNVPITVFISVPFRSNLVLLPVEDPRPCKLFLPGSLIDLDMFLPVAELGSLSNPL